MTREEAKAAGLKRYQGQSCVRGHDGTRFTSSGECVACKRERVRRYRGNGSKREPRQPPHRLRPQLAEAVHTPELPVAHSDFIQAITRERLMAGK